MKLDLFKRRAGRGPRSLCGRMRTPASALLVVALVLLAQTSAKKLKSPVTRDHMKASTHPLHCPSTEPP